MTEIVRQKRSLYQCFNAKCKNRDIFCAAGHRLRSSGTIEMKQLEEGEALEFPVCQACLDYDGMGPPIPPHQRGWKMPESVEADDRSMIITDLNLSPRTINALRRSGIYTVQQILDHSEEQLLSKRNFGVVCLLQLKKALAELGIEYGN